MLPIEVRIERTERLIRMLEQDAPLMKIRFADLPAERKHSAQQYAAQVSAMAHAELQKLRAESSPGRRAKLASVGR